MIAVILEVFKLSLGAFLALQWVSIMLFLIAEWAMVDFYKLGTFDNPKSVFDKVPDFIMRLILGTGFYFNNRFSKYNWFTRKLYMLIALILIGVVSIIIYNLITVPLDLIFN